MQTLARQGRHRGRHALTAAMLSFGSTVALCGPCWGQTTVVRKPDTTIPGDSSALNTLPVALRKNVPETAADLQEIEDHVQTMVADLIGCTVGLRIGSAQGSGVIVSEDGYVLTAAHVSGPPGRRIEVALSDGTITIGRTMGRSRFLDASLIKIDASNRKYAYARLGAIGNVHHGDWCLVTGHPGGYQPDRPPVLRMGRVIAIDNRLIQTDCELVGGDSGGPVFDMQGKVIAI
ncbi:MAG: trypsin-like peptidase domain-containing protein, partial [Planctomycetaceae bacterium]|nr:trypsin-like peptidase domain-containing protein [Planctomycetaceae bacterium]